MKIPINKVKDNLNIIVLFFLGVVCWSLTMVKSGLVYSYGMGFWGPNGHDGIWHIALIESLAKGSWQMPVFAGETIKNYHIGFDLIMAGLHKISFIPVKTLYFQITPPILAIGIGYFIYRFVLVWRNSRRDAFWATFFTYFGGSLGWIVTFIRNGKFEGESMFWSQQAISTLINPPFALSLVFVFLGLILLVKGLDEKNKKYLTLATFLFGILIQIKVYAGILILAGLFVAGFWYLIEKGSATLFKVFSGVLIITLLLFLPVVPEASKTVIWSPFWFLETMMSDPSRLFWPKFAQAMINYRLGGIFIKEIVAYSVAFLIFILGNMGLRTIGFAWIFKKGLKHTNYSYIDILVITVLSSGIVLPMFFVQRGTTWNTIQFFYYSLIFSGILAGIVFSRMLRSINNSLLKYGIIFILFVISVPSTIATLRNYLPARPPSMVSKEEIEALRFMRGLPDGIILTQPFDKDASEKAVNNPPRPLYLYESTAYVSAFTAKPTYLEDEVNLEITGYDWKLRRNEVLDYFNNSGNMNMFLKDKNISYIYFIKDAGKNFLNGSLEKVFENSKVIIYFVSPPKRN
jgi:hypothetical protein